jgi:polygalacturonase
MNLRKRSLLSAAFITISLLCLGTSRLASSSAQRTVDASAYNVKTFGAKGDGKTLDTAAINKAIDAAAAAGGGTVYFPAGNFLSVSIHL